MTERLIPFDLEAAKADPSRVRHADYAAHEVRIAGDLVCIRYDRVCWNAHGPSEYRDLRLTAPAPKRVEVRASLWSDGVVTVTLDDEPLMRYGTMNVDFVRWLTNWHIEDGRVFVEVE